MSQNLDIFSTEAEAPKPSRPQTHKNSLVAPSPYNKFMLEDPKSGKRNSAHRLMSATTGSNWPGKPRLDIYETQPEDVGSDLNFNPNAIKFKSKTTQAKNRRLADRLTQLRELE